MGTLVNLAFTISAGYTLIRLELKIRKIDEWNDIDFIKDYEYKINIYLDITTPLQSEFKTKMNLALAIG